MNQKGFTLLEVLVACAISMVVMLAAMTMLDTVFKGTETAKRRIGVETIKRQLGEIVLDPTTCFEAFSPQKLDVPASINIYVPKKYDPVAPPGSIFLKSGDANAESVKITASTPPSADGKNPGKASLEVKLWAPTVGNASFAYNSTIKLDVYYWNKADGTVRSCGLVPIDEVASPTATAAEIQCPANKYCQGVPTVCLKPIRRKTSCKHENIATGLTTGYYCRYRPPYVNESNGSYMDRIYFCPAGVDKVYLGANPGSPDSSDASPKNCKVLGGGSGFPSSGTSSIYSHWVLNNLGMLYDCAGGVTMVSTPGVDLQWPTGPEVSDPIPH